MVVFALRLNHLLTGQNAKDAVFLLAEFRESILDESVQACLAQDPADRFP